MKRIDAPSADAFAARESRPVGVAAARNCVGVAGIDVDALAVAGNKARYLKGDTLRGGILLLFLFFISFCSNSTRVCA